MHSLLLCMLNCMNHFTKTMQSEWHRAVKRWERVILSICRRVQMRDIHIFLSCWAKEMDRNIDKNEIKWEKTCSFLLHSSLSGFQRKISFLSRLLEVYMFFEVIWIFELRTHNIDPSIILHTFYAHCIYTHETDNSVSSTTMNRTYY